MDTEEVEDARLICEICGNVLINAVGTACGHTFCKYCLYMWKKHDVNICPNTSCMRDMGKIVLRPEIDKYIADFFATANTLAQTERSCFLKARKKESDVPDLEKIVFRTRNSGKKSLDDGPRCSTRGRTPGHRVNPVRSGQVNENFQKLSKETKTLATELKGTYARVLELGANINAEEGSLAKQFFDPNSSVKVSLNDRPCTAGPGLGVAKILHRPRDKSEVDDLIEETNEIIKIEKFLKKFSFENIKMMEDSEAMSSEDLHKEAIKDLEKLSIRGPKKSSTDIPGEIKSGLKVHQEVQKYMADKKLKVTPIVPCVDKDAIVSCTPRVPKTPRGAEKPDPELLKCCDDLRKIKKGLSNNSIEEHLTKTKRITSTLGERPASRMSHEIRPQTQKDDSKQSKPKKSAGSKTTELQGSSSSKVQAHSGNLTTAATKLPVLPSSKGQTAAAADNPPKKSPKPSTARPKTRGEP